MNKFSTSFCLLFIITGCSTVTDYAKNIISDPRNENLVYKTDKDYSATQKDLILPPNVTKPVNKDILSLPDVVKNDTNKLFSVDTKLENIKIFKEGSSMFLSVSMKNKILLWEKLKSFWLEEGFQLVNSDLTTSSMRTNYLENLSEVQLGTIQRVVGRYVPLLVSPETRDSYSTRVIKNDESYEIFVTHYGKEFMSDGDSDFRWQNRARDTEFENEMISRMYIYLGGEEAKESGYVVAKVNRSSSSTRISTDDQGLQTLYIPDIYERVYPAVVSSLEILGVKIISQDQSEGVIKVTLDDTESSSQGFFNRLFSSDANEELNIKLNLGGEKGESTLIIIENNSFTQMKTPASEELIRGLYVKLR
tara:strand:+ start:967 stop:2055 length:1089 start_codon:yes stop_codon:yes gene_type:complete